MDDLAAAGLYDLLNPWAADDDFYAAFAGPPGGTTVLDLACGTGRLAAALADRGQAVIGVDLDEAMLAAARARTSAVEWIAGDVRALRLGRRFDRVLCTGHAFQALLTDADQDAFLATVAAHLGEDGRFAFETRNPAARAWLGWTPAASRRLVRRSTVEVHHEAGEPDPLGIVRLTTVYRHAGRERREESRLRFTRPADLLARAEAAGLRTLAVYGDWDRSRLNEDSREVIVTGTLA